jgi:hypothetical protein
MLSSGNRNRRRIIQIILPVLLANMLVVFAGEGFVFIYFEAQSSAIEKYPFLTLVLIMCVLPLMCVLQKYISKALVKKLEVVKKAGPRWLRGRVRHEPKVIGYKATAWLAAYLLSSVLLVVPAIGYAFTRDLQYNAQFRKLIDVGNHLYNSNTRCDLNNSEIRVQSFLTWRGGAEAVVDTAYIAVEAEGVIVGKGRDENKILLSVAKPTLVTFIATDQATDDDVKEYNEFKAIHDNFVKLRERIIAGRFSCSIVLIASPISMEVRQEETKELMSRSWLEFLKKIYSR